MPRFLRSQTSVRSVAVVGVFFAAGFVAVNGHPVIQQGVYEVASAALLVLFIVGLRRNIPRRSRIWQALSLAVGLEVFGDVAAGFPDAPNPTWLAHALYLAGIPLFAVALVGCMRPRRLRGEGPLPQLLDSAIVFVSGFAVLWFVRVDSNFDRPAPVGHERVWAVAYPLLDWLIVALVLRFVFSPGRWPPALRLLLGAVVLMFATDLAWQGDSVGSSSTHLWTGLGSLLSYLLWALVGLHPSVVEVEGLSLANDAQAAVLHRRRVVLLLLAALVPGSLLLLTHGLDGNAGGHEDISALLLVAIGVPVLIVARLADLLRTLRRSTEEAHEAHSDLKAVIEASPVPICVTDPQAAVLIWNPAAEHASGYAVAEVLGKPPPVVPAEDAERVAALYAAALDGEIQRGVEIKLLDRSERPLDVRFSTAPLGGGQRGVVVLFEDVTEQKRAAEKIEFLASHDPLTGLPNRRSFERELGQAVARAARGADATLLLLDIDNFKAVNDSGGHPVGDRFLIEVAHRLSDQIRPGDAISRLSGDEFAVLLVDTPRTQAELVADRLLDAIRDYRLESRAGVFDITVSVGIYQLRADEIAERALRRADEALYEAKAHGKNQQRTWSPESPAVLGASRGWSPRIKDALRDDRVEAFLQPIVDVSSEKVVYHEALCRLRRDDGSYIEPGAFLGHAERLGLMAAIDRRMLDQADRIIREHEGVRVLVNLSASSFDDQGLLQRLHAILAAVPAGSLGIEVTEQAALTDLSRAVEELEALKSLGALIAIDDFGVGFTSFEHLRRLPVDLVKVGNGFLDGLATDPVTSAILDGIVSTAHALSMRVVAEGVEDRATAGLLRARNIAYAQGYLYGRPSPVSRALSNSCVQNTKADSCGVAAEPGAA